MRVLAVEGAEERFGGFFGTAHEVSPPCAAFPPDGQFGLSAGTDGFVRVWELPPYREAF